MDVADSETGVALAIFVVLLPVARSGLLGASRRAAANDAARHARPGPYTVTSEQHRSLALARPDDRPTSRPWLGPSPAGTGTAPAGCDRTGSEQEDHG